MSSGGLRRSPAATTAGPAVRDVRRVLADSAVVRAPPARGRGTAGGEKVGRGPVELGAADLGLLRLALGFVRLRRRTDVNSH